MQRAMATSAAYVAFLFYASAQVTPAKLATAARVDLNAAPEVGSITDGALVSGSGSLERQTWLPSQDQPRTYTLQAGVVRFAWNSFTVRFVPTRSGTVQMSLRGPWEEITPGTGRIYRQEILWDALTATGTTLAHASFETVNNGLMTGWTGGVSQNGTAALPAVDGQRMARAWHDDSMTRSLTVTAGVPVTLGFYARAHIPSGFSEMKRIGDPNSPAHRRALKFMRGVNFGNYLEIPPGTGGSLTYSSLDFAQARAEGFDHIRLPVAWQHYAGSGPAFTLGPGIFERVDFMVTNALREGLSVMVDVHNFEEFVRDPPAHTNKLFALWQQIAAYYADAPPEVAFEILNEPRDAATTSVMNPIFAEAIRQVRTTNPDRTLFIGTGAFNGVSELNHLLLPDHDSNLVATVHTYDPFLFTHQGLSWAGTDAAATPGIRFPGPPAVPLVPAAGISEWATNWIKEYNTLPTERNPSSGAAMRGPLQFAAQWSEYYGRPVHVGEFGAFETIEPQSRINYYRTKRQILDDLGLGWAIWDWKAGFHYSRNGAPDPPGLHDALFPAPALRTSSRGLIEFEAARGKTFVIERTRSLVPPLAWRAISTQYVAAPKINFSDPDAAQNPSAFYRAREMK